MQKKKGYIVATAHLDTVWRWRLAQTINEYLPDTLSKNFEYFEKYPNYRFNFEGAYRYELIEEYYPLAFEKVKQYAKENKWMPTGSSYENGDVNIPSPEALIRNIMIGNNYFKKVFGKKTNDIFLPDCFGFGYALPSVMHHTNLKGFITQKLSWGSAYGQPFDIGIWQGVDGSQVFASLDARSYCSKFSGDIRGEIPVIDKVAKNAFESGNPLTIQLYGVGDKGGAPTKESVENVCNSVDKNESSDFDIISANPTEIFDDLDTLPKEKKDALKVWNNELVMTSHGAGGYTSRAMSKRLNRKCELLADKAERSLVLSDMLGVYKYPFDTMTSAWKKLIRHQFHDDLPGTSLMEVYNDSWNDYYTAQCQFLGEYSASIGAIANELDTSWVTECAVIVNNSVATKRSDSVKAHVKLLHNAKYVKVLDSQGNEVKSQVISKNGKEFDIVFLASVDSVSYSVYDVIASNEKCNIKTDLKCTEHTLENEKYKLMFNKNGDIGSLIDKKLNKQLLESPIKMAVLSDIGLLNYPSWEMRKDDLDKEPIGYANTPIFEIVENGSARIAIKVSREIGYSKIEQIVSMTSGSEIITVDNFVDWQSRRAMLKATFPFSCYNKDASYDLGLGVIKRATNTEKIYEVPAQKWADITSATKEYGVSIFSDSKYGWDKPSGNTLRLTCIHTPLGAFTKETRQDLQEIGRNIFSFAIFSHKGDIENGTQRESELYSQPLTAFQTSSRKSGALGANFSLCNIDNDSVIIRAIKRSENQTGYVVRFNEANNKEIKNVIFSFYKNITTANEVFGDEDYKADAKVKDGSLIFDLKPYEIKSFYVEVEKSEKKQNENFKKLNLPYNSQGFTSEDNMRNIILQGSGFSLPSEQIENTITRNGVTFKIAKGELKDVLVARGDTIEIPKGMTKLYFLASSTLSDKKVTFFIDNKEKEMTIHSMKENVFTWDMAGLSQTANVKEAMPVVEFTHCHHPEGNRADEKAYFFMYELPIRNASTITLPEENSVVILAMTAVKKFSNTNLATAILDTASNDYKFGEIPPIDKIIDKTEFISIRAGKIQDQAIGGKGKGFKRDNPITNIIRSYTKSDW